MPFMDKNSVTKYLSNYHITNMNNQLHFQETFNQVTRAIVIKQ